ncbi:MAG: HlyD family efflux transporter periplasmic adaptor subunit [Aliidongia sp.]
MTNLDLHPGDYLTAGTQVLALVDTDSLRVEGYFEETKLRHIHIGDEARIRLMGEPDMLQGPCRKHRGRNLQTIRRRTPAIFFRLWCRPSRG